MESCHFFSSPYLLFSMHFEMRVMIKFLTGGMLKENMMRVLILDALVLLTICQV
jgi:hypothetical protein